MDAKDYEKQLHDSLESAQNKKDAFSEELKKLKNKTTELASSKNSQADKFELLQKEIVESSKSEKYISILNWRNENYTKEDISEDFLINEKDIFEGRLNTISERISSLEVSIATLSTELEKDKLKDLKQLKVEIEGKLRDYEFKCKIYEDFLEEKLDLDVINLNKKTLIKKIREIGNHLDSKLKKNRELILEYRLLADSLEKVSPYLQSELAKSELVDKRTLLRFYSGDMFKLIDEEITKTKEYLDEKVEEFFFEDLINDLYSKIDPHPELKEITFKADFDSPSPRLDVFVKNPNSDDPDLIPNLYFSTAQINILSLSIFLANALKSDEYDCIFIDDPIQSLDSINILSTIDLLRSIVVNHKKQIILSTHDEQFFKLLQKKMPRNLFKSKFLELEGLGKLKAQSA